MGTSVSIRSRIKNTKNARIQLLSNNWDHILIVHYSCDSFYYKQPGERSRITAISIRNLRGNIRETFSIHRSAIKLKCKSKEEIIERLAELELDLLKDYFSFVAQRVDAHWVHWNMESGLFGFKTLEHRMSEDFGEHPTTVQDTKKFNLAMHLRELYGPTYACDPRLDNTMRMNQINVLNYLPGGQEAVAVHCHRYEELHNSTEAKVNVIAEILRLTNDGQLKTHTNFFQRNRGNIPALLEAIIDSLWFKVTGGIALVWSILQLLDRFFHFLPKP